MQVKLRSWTQPRQPSADRRREGDGGHGLRGSAIECPCELNGARRSACRALNYAAMIVMTMLGFYF